LNSLHLILDINNKKIEYIGKAIIYDYEELSGKPLHFEVVGVACVWIDTYFDHSE